jgi:hypothetical protein
VPFPRLTKLSDLQQTHRQWVNDALHGALTRRDRRWTQVLAVGGQAFVEKIKDELGGKALHRGLDRLDGTYALREAHGAYRGHFDVENAALRPKKRFFGKTIA